MSTYQDYMELRSLFRGFLKEGIVMSQEVKRLYWRELKWLERDTRCHDENGKRCMKDCRKCDKRRDGAPFSLDQMIEIGNIPQDTFSVEVFFEEMDLSESLSAAIGRLSDRDKLIVALFAKGYTEREIANIIGVSQKTVNNRKKLIFDELRAFLKDYC